MNKILTLLTFFLIGCNNHNDTCLPPMKVIHSKLRSTLFSFQNKFATYSDVSSPNIIKLRKKYSCFSKLTPKLYAKNSNYTIIVFSENNENGVIVILNNEIEKLIKINNFNKYQFKGISLEDETLSIFLTYKKMKQKINFKPQNGYIFWNEYEF